MLLWSLAQLRLVPPESWLAVLVEAAYGQLHAAEPRHCACMMWACAKMQRVPPQPWLDRWAGRRRGTARYSGVQCGVLRALPCPALP